MAIMVRRSAANFRRLWESTADSVATRSEGRRRPVKRRARAPLGPWFKPRGTWQKSGLTKLDKNIPNPLPTRYGCGTAAPVLANAALRARMPPILVPVVHTHDEAVPADFNIGQREKGGRPYGPTVFQARYQFLSETQTDAAAHLVGSHPGIVNRKRDARIRFHHSKSSARIGAHMPSAITEFVHGTQHHAGGYDPATCRQIRKMFARRARRHPFDFGLEAIVAIDRAERIPGFEALPSG